MMNKETHMKNSKKLLFTVLLSSTLMGLSSLPIMAKSNSSIIDNEKLDDTVELAKQKESTIESVFNQFNIQSYSNEKTKKIEKNFNEYKTTVSNTQKNKKKLNDLREKIELLKTKKTTTQEQIKDVKTSLETKIDCLGKDKKKTKQYLQYQSTLKKVLMNGEKVDLSSIKDEKTFNQFNLLAKEVSQLNDVKSTLKKTSNEYQTTYSLYLDQLNEEEFQQQAFTTQLRNMNNLNLDE